MPMRNLSLICQYCGKPKFVCDDPAKDLEHVKYRHRLEKLIRNLIRKKGNL